MVDFAEVRFRAGWNKRFFNANIAAHKAGYPDVVSYLKATGQVIGECEEVPRSQIETELKAEELRHNLKSNLE